MESPNPTQHYINNSVLAVMHSVALIESFNEKILTDVEFSRKARNVEHLQIMMKKTWFSEALTVEQTNRINLLLPE